MLYSLDAEAMLFLVELSVSNVSGVVGTHRASSDLLDLMFKL